MRWRALLIALAPCGGVANAQEVRTSTAPDKVAVTVYREPDRDATRKLNLRWLGGYALVTETRTIDIPAGRTTIRFEGVASGILPESAIVTGLPAGVREKNLDGDLLAPASLYARGHARPVTLRRTRDGRSVEERAIIRSGPDGAAIVETERGIEVLNCGPTDDAITYDGVPAGLSARPTLSVQLDSPTAQRARVTLSYLAWGFDWQANYIATLHAGGKLGETRVADLFAWVTLASTDLTSFADADTMVVAGKVNRSTGRTAGPFDYIEPLIFRCYAIGPRPGAPPPPPPPPPPAPMRMDSATVIVTAARVGRARQVVQEELGDLKTYRVPEPTTIAARSQKQVAMLARDAVPVRIVYEAQVFGEAVTQPQIILRAVNRADRGLGLPLPAGPVALFERQGTVPTAQDYLIGESTTDDKAIGEDVEFKFDGAANVTTEVKQIYRNERYVRTELTVRNANPFAIAFEADFQTDGKLRSPSARLARRNGRERWIVTIPANGGATLRYGERSSGGDA